MRSLCERATAMSMVCSDGRATFKSSQSRNFLEIPHPSRSPLQGWWARLGLNQRPLACEASALPLSYAPIPVVGGNSGCGRALSSGQ